jgi:hypothetical protein
VKTDIESAYGVVCNYVPTLHASTPAFVKLSGSTITIDESLTSLANVGLTTVTVIVVCLEYPGGIPDAFYSFTVDV